MKRWMVILLFLPLCGCYATQKKQLAACEFESRRALGKDFTIKQESLDPWDSSGGRLIELCMEGAGYERGILDVDCNPSISPVIQARCYQPADALVQLIYKMQTVLCKKDYFHCLP
jgi:hypothetical protein